jgi:hypothetical protein
VPPRSTVGAHIVASIDKARRLDPSLTIRAATRELGISESSYFKLRAGTRTGQGSIRQRVIDAPHRESGRPQSTANAFTVTFRSGDRVGSRNVDVKGRFTKADALVLRHDPRFRKVIVKQLAKEERARERYQIGSPPWTRRQREQLVLTEVRRRVYGERPSFFVRESLG